MNPTPGCGGRVKIKLVNIIWGAESGVAKDLFSKNENVFYPKLEEALSFFLYIGGLRRLCRILVAFIDLKNIGGLC